MVNIANANPRMEVAVRIDGKPVEVGKAFNDIYPNAPDHTFMGFYVDVSNLKPDSRHTVGVGLPKLEPGQFQGLYFDNVETEYTGAVSSST